MFDFKFKPFSEMTTKDYEEVGFMSGLEIHQQLLTEKKLFCRCPAGFYNTKYDAEILRHMRPTLSELGEYDGTALMEFKTKKDIIYRIHRDTVCTYEMDDTPPFLINDEALDIAIQIGMLLNSDLVDELHIIRKQYLDGSIPTGFQRTAIICVNGWVPFKDRRINIIQMSIEEDSCREVSDIGHRRVYLTDRLGMPLIETVTAPDMKTPFEVAEVNQLLRSLVRTTGKVRTGIGAGREDVNVSVRGGTRIEIKGVSKIKYIPLLTYNEAMRQWNLLRLSEELHRRGITPDTFSAKTDDITKIMKNTHYEPIRNALSEGKSIKCVTLRGFKNLLHWQTQTDTYFAKEISDRARVIACLTTLPNIIHTDSFEITISTSEMLQVKKSVGASDDDTLVLVWGNEVDTTTGAKEIIIRAKEATVGVPSETRQALRDGTNGFERILPGPDRMYPDTDLPPKQITQERLDKLRAGLPVQIWKNESWYTELDVPADLIKSLATSTYTSLFKKLVDDWKIDPKLAAVALIQFPKRLKRKKIITENPSSEIFLQIFDFYKNNKIAKDTLLYALEEMIKKGNCNSYLSIEKIEPKIINTQIMSAVGDMKKTKIKTPINSKSYIMGKVMAEFRCKVPAALVSNYVDEILNGENQNGK